MSSLVWLLPVLEAERAQQVVDDGKAEPDGGVIGMHHLFSLLVVSQCITPLTLL